MFGHGLHARRRYGIHGDRIVPPGGGVVIAVLVMLPFYAAMAWWLL